MLIIEQFRKIKQFKMLFIEQFWKIEQFKMSTSLFLPFKVYFSFVLWTNSRWHFLHFLFFWIIKILISKNFLEKKLDKDFYLQKYLFSRHSWAPKISSKNRGCGSVGRAVASNTRGPWLESSHRKILCTSTNGQLYRKDETK